jgi:hypothetical protein
MSAVDAALRAEINKRLTLNWLIQGAAQQAGITLHHLVRDDLNAMDPRLIPLYDQFALVNLLQYWQLDGVLLLGRPSRFWRRAKTSRRHPFFHHPLLSRHGEELAETSRRRGVERAKEKGLTQRPIAFSFQGTLIMQRLRSIESAHRQPLIDLAKRAASRAWGISVDRFDASIEPATKTTSAFPRLPPPHSLRGFIFRAAVVGYGGVVARGGRLIVTARATNWQLLAKELVKGTAELICLHGLNRFDDQTYDAVTRAADRLEFEPWMLQTGGELWRRLLAVTPAGRSASRVLMYLARLEPDALESLMLAVLERPDGARKWLAMLVPRDDE